MQQVSVGLLALIADDPLAPKVLAWWKASGPQLSDRDGPEFFAEAARALGIDSVHQVRRTFNLCFLAGTLVDGGISEIADKWLNAWVGRQMGIKPSVKRGK